MLLGKNQTQAAYEAYTCKNKNTAGAIATRVMKKDRVKRLLKKGKERTEESLIRQVERSIADELKALGITRKEIAQRSRDLLYSKDQRVSMNALHWLSQVLGLYAPKTNVSLQVQELYQHIEEGREEFVAPKEDIVGEIVEDTKEDKKKDS